MCALRPAHADPSDAEIIGSDPGWRVEDFQLRTTYLDQRGTGFQAQGGPVGTAGSEAMYIFQPSAFVTIRQSDRIVHTITLPIDAITAASPDAVDATTEASRRNTAGDLDVRSAIRTGDHDTITLREVLHVEEWIAGGTLGLGWKRNLADDNATISVNGSFGIDVFDDHNHFGNFLGKTGRASSNINISGSQLLSPTTVIDASYGLTYQHGMLKTGWNAVPLANGTLADEFMPHHRLRQALSVRVAQHVPVTHSTVKVSYRFYLDDFGLQAHTIDTSFYQYLVDWLYVRGGYRFYHQTAVDFFSTSLDDVNQFRTSDSDLAAFNANEVSLQLATVRGRGPLHKWSLSGEALRYVRSNDLRITTVSLSIGRLM